MNLDTQTEWLANLLNANLSTILYYNMLYLLLYMDVAVGGGCWVRERKQLISVKLCTSSTRSMPSENFSGIVLCQ